MSSTSSIRPDLLLLLFVAPIALADSGDYMIGAGVEADSEDGVAISAIGDVAVGEATWLSGSAAHSDFELPRGEQIDNLYVDFALDHLFDPVGVRVGAAYWGDPDLLESRDVRAALYFRGDSSFLSLDAERRDFEFSIPAGDFLPATTVGFDATGIGLSGSVDIGESARLRGSAISYDYSRDFRFGDSDRIRDLLIFTRLSVLSSLVDWRAGAGVSVDAGAATWQFDVTGWHGAIDDSDNLGATVSFLAPLTNRSDVELSLGYDDSDLYGDVTFLSLFLYFYGSN